MTAISGLERLLERLVERTLARAFRAPVRLVQVERRIERTMDAAGRTVGGRTEVPERYRVRISPLELRGLGGGEPEALAADLAEGALAYARRRGYHLAARPTVDVVADRSLPRGTIEVDAVARRTGLDPVSPRDAGPRLPGRTDPRGPARADDSPATPVRSPAPDAPAAAMGWGTASAPDALRPATTTDPLGRGESGTAERPDSTRPFRRPVPNLPRVVLRETGPDGRERTIPIETLPMAIGRARENDLVLPDRGVSRYHGRLQVRRGALVYADLGSTNGSWVNGIRVDEIALGLGDRLRLGSTTLVVERQVG